MLLGDDLTDNIVNADYDENGEAVVNGKKYLKWYNKHYADPNGKWTFLNPDLAKMEYLYFVEEPVEWQVLEVKDGKAFVVSKYGLDYGQYHSEKCINGNIYHSSKVTWEICDLREWMNTEMYDSMFTAKEKESVVLSHVENPDNEKFKVEGGNDTEDYLYMLSIEEFTKFFGKSEDIDGLVVGGEPWWDYCNEDGYTQPTDYSMAQGIWNGATTSDWNYPNCNYWLRSPAMDTNTVAYVESNGGCMDELSNYVTGRINIRPCMWVDLATADVKKVENLSYLSCWELSDMAIERWETHPASPKNQQ